MVSTCFGMFQNTDYDPLKNFLQLLLEYGKIIKNIKQ